MTPQVAIGRSLPETRLDTTPVTFKSSDLAQAISTGQVTLHYQPQVELTSGLVLGVEALARWVHPTRGTLWPGAFLPAVARAGLMHELTLHVLNLGAQQASRWVAAGRATRVSVNVSASDLHSPGFTTRVRETLDRHRLDPVHMGLEVTETDAMTDPEHCHEVLNDLRQFGVHLSVDDYGTGHSSLMYLQRFPFRTLKLDQVFVAGMLEDDGSLAIVRSTIAMARELGIPVLAEGVEDDATLLALRELRCFAAQGFGLARPVPADELVETVARVEARLVPLLTAEPWGRTPDAGSRPSAHRAP